MPVVDPGGEGPRDLEILNIGAGDLIERAVAGALEISGGCPPLAVGGRTDRHGHRRVSGVAGSGAGEFFLSPLRFRGDRDQRRNECNQQGRPWAAEPF